LEEDVVSGAADNHPVSTAVGAVGGTLAGAALGAALGPIGALSGAAVGSMIGAVAGKGIAKGIDPEAETAYWQRRYREEPYYQAEYSFDDYGPAYGLGWRLYAPDTSFESSEKVMSLLVVVNEWRYGVKEDGNCMLFSEKFEGL
jgi:hypothetical protein